MVWLQLFFVVIGVGLIGMGEVAGGLLTLFLTLVLYMCDVSIEYLREVE